MIEKLINYNNMYTTTTTLDQNLNMMSLFDYLGHAAGKDLGKNVALYAAEKNILPQTRHVSNKKYTGQVMLYPKHFLDNYFNSRK
jgi:hypothetical protein